MLVSRTKNVLLIFILICFQLKISFAHTTIKIDTSYFKEISYDSLWRIKEYMEGFEKKQVEFVIDYIINRSKSEKNVAIQFKGLIGKGRFYEEQMRLFEALQCYDIAASLVKNIDFKSFISTQIDRAYIFEKLKNYSETRNIYFNIIELSKENKDFENLQNAYCGLGLLYENIKDYNTAIRYYKEAVSIAKKVKNNKNTSIYLGNIAESFCKNKDYHQAYHFIAEAYQFVPNNDFEARNLIYVQYAEILANMNRFDEALAKIEEGFQYCVGNYAQRYKNQLSIAKAMVFLKKGDNITAKSIFLDCLSRRQNINNLIKIHLELGKIFQNNQEINNAKKYFETGLTLATQNNFPDYAQQAHFSLANLYAKEENGLKAYFHLKNANLLRDSLFDFEKTAKLSELQFKFDLEQSEHKIKDLELRSTRIILIAIGFISFLLFAAMFYIMRLRNKGYRILKENKDKIEHQKDLLETANHTLELKNHEIEAQKKQLEESNNMMRQFSYAAAHDLKEPLRSISNFIRIIEKKYIKQLPNEAHDYFAFVSSGANRMGQMLEGLLRYSMMTSSKVTDVETFELCEVIDEVIDSLSARILERNAEIIVCQKMPLVKMNRLHATQLIQNLLNNALKFVDKQPKIEIECHIEGKKAVLSIKDNGIGIDEVSGKNLFQLFQRVHKDNAKFEGTGVGLALCKNIVEKYDGKIWFESKSNLGTTFFMNLPKAA